MCLQNLKEQFTPETTQPYLNHVLDTIIILLGLECVQFVLLEIFIFRGLLCFTVILKVPECISVQLTDAPPK